MTDAERYGLFFYFLRNGLYGMEERYDGVLPTREDWDWIFERAYEQAVTGLIVDGIGITAMRPETDCWEQWIFHILSLEEMNRKIARSGNLWLQRLEAVGIKAFVFKGSSVAAWYREPFHRSFGDVDLVVQNGWYGLETFLQRCGLDFRNDHGDLVLTDEEQVLVEFHRVWERIYNPWNNMRLQRRCVRAEATDRELYLVCLMLHLRRHFLTYGVGLKQVCDVAMVLQDKELDSKKVAEILQELRMEKFSRVLFGFITCYIENHTDLPLQPITNGADFDLFREIVWKDGYLLKMHREEVAQESRYALERVFFNTVFWMKRSWRLFRLMPGEAFFFLVYLIGRRVRSMFVFK